MKPINKNVLNKFIEKASKKLAGKWVILGGNVIQALGIADRFTVDIDIAGPQKHTQSETIKLLEIAEDLGLPVETINESAAIFLYRIAGWEKHLVLLHEGEKSNFYRPDIYLFVLMKMKRLSESDLSDCLIFLNKKVDTFEKKGLLKAVSFEIKNTEVQEKKERLKKLKLAIEQS